VRLACDGALNTLGHLPGKRYHGAPGADAFRRTSGAGGAPCVIRVPPGTIVTNTATNQTYQTLRPGESLLVCLGGAGGKGNGASGCDDKVAPSGGGTKAHINICGKVCLLYLF
jgi:GTPase involved in cell partitioning and DNA repair